MTANALTAQAVDALRVATLLQRQYMQDVRDRLAVRLGLKIGAAPRLIQRTPDGFFPSRLVRVEQIAAGGASAGQVQVLVTPKPPRGADCVLGQSFLARFHITGPGNGAVLLVPFSTDEP